MKLKLPAIKTEYSIKRIHFTAENLYLLVYALYSFFYIFNHSTLNIEIVSKAVKGLTILVLGMLFAALDYTDVKKLIARVMVLLLFAVTAFTNGSLVFLCSGLLLTCACLTNFRKICKVSLISSFSAAVTVIAAAFAGIAENRIFDHDGAKGQSLGFYFYSTYPYIFIFNMVTYMYLRKKLSWLEIALFFGINFLIYYFSSLRLTFYLGFIVLALYIVLIKLDFIQLRRGIIKLLAVLIYPATCMTMAVVVRTKNFHFGFWAKANELFNGRLLLSQTGFQKYPVTLLGQNIEMQGVQYQKRSYTEYFFIDSGYIYSILGYGLFFTCMILLMHSLLYYRTCERNDKKCFIWLSAILIFNTVNNMFTSFAYNPLLLLYFANHSEYGNIFSYFRRKLFHSKEAY